MFSLERQECLKRSFARVVLVVVAVSCAAQTSRVAGAIQGNIVDQSGSALAGASVTIRNQGTNQTRTVLSDAQGFFRASELSVGQYELRVESPSFSPYANSAIMSGPFTCVHEFPAQEWS
jgi:carboxypeptidase family protein